MREHTTIVLLALMVLGGCKSTYYSTWEKLGWAKRDILVDRVEDARDEQAKAKEQFKTTLERFQELTKFEGGALEGKYKKLNSEYESCAKRAQAVSDEIAAVDEVAQDMFVEWKKELGEYKDAGLRRDSEQKLRDAKDRYGELLTAMRKSEASMQPVLGAFHDQVLYLKHNLNAQAISSLATTTARIDEDVQKLIKNMEAAIAEADAFIGELKKG